MTRPTRFCVYCLLPHDRDSAGCCPEHARKVGAANAAATRKANRVLAEVRARANHRAFTRPLWRQISLGLNVEENVRSIFASRARLL